jgi:predicted N-acyltransferase
MALHFETFSQVEAIDKQLWNRMAAWASPMMEWEYFNALEKSDSVSLERGYRPSHLVAYSDERPIAIAPLYERDRAWVEFGDGGLIEFLSELTGLPYQRGLVGTIPFTPVPGYEFLHDNSIDGYEAYTILLNYIDFLCHSRQLSTSRIYFVSLASPNLHAALSKQGYVCLKSQYCLWLNRNFQTFDDYLKSFKSSRRTKIKRELRTVRDMGIDIRMIDAAEVTDELYNDMYELYVRTWLKHMGPQVRPFLNRTFFRLLDETFRHRNSFSVASRSGERIALALFYHKLNNIYGRYWGCFEEAPFLHFATCYYYPIQYAVEHSVRMMDPGFGGEHKLIRGYEIVPVYHYIKFYGERERRMADALLSQLQRDPESGCHRI